MARLEDSMIWNFKLEPKEEPELDPLIASSVEYTDMWGKPNPDHPLRLYASGKVEDDERGTVRHVDALIVKLVKKRLYNGEK